jgi:catechol 2,3-dioxygenase-like lactoylglutathione lyase family enzyme
MIQHVTHRIPRSRLQDCVSFYEILGFRQVQAPPGIAGRALWLQAEDGDQVHLMPGDDEPTAPGEGHFALVEPDYEITLDRLRAAGHEVEPRREHWGSPRSYVRDPAGNLVELMQWAPGTPGRPGAPGEPAGPGRRGTPDEAARPRRPGRE